MPDTSIDIEQELVEAQARFPITLSDRELPLEMSIRALALTIAQRHVSDTVVKEGNLYQQLKLDNKPLTVVSVNNVITTALVFERYLLGEFSKGLAEQALNATMTEMSEQVDETFRKTQTDNV